MPQKEINKTISSRFFIVTRWFRTDSFLKCYWLHPALLPCPYARNVPTTEYTPVAADGTVPGCRRTVRPDRAGSLQTAPAMWYGAVLPYGPVAASSLRNSVLRPLSKRNVPLPVVFLLTQHC